MWRRPERVGAVLIVGLSVLGVGAQPRSAHAQVPTDHSVLVVQVLIDGTDLDLAGGGWSEATVVDALNRPVASVARGDLVGSVTAVYDGPHAGQVWTITAEGPSIASEPQPATGQLIVVATRELGYAIVQATNTAGANGGADLAAPPDALTSIDIVPRRTNNFVSSLADGGDRADSIERDPGNATFEGGTYDGLPIMRLTGYAPGDGGEVELGGQEFVNPNTVVFLNHQKTAENNGVWELFTDDAGTYGSAGDVYLVRTLVWNSTTDGYVSSPQRSPSGNVFFVASGDGQGLWATQDDGLQTNATRLTEPLNAPAPASDRAEETAPPAPVPTEATKRDGGISDYWWAFLSGSILVLALVLWTRGRPAGSAD